MILDRHYDSINRLKSITSTPMGAQPFPWTYEYDYNSANQRTNVTLADGSAWRYSYDSLGQVTSGKRYWSSGEAVSGQQFEYGFDHIGNRTSSKRGGNSSGSSLRSSIYTVNNKNQYTQRTLTGGYTDVIGIATAGTTVLVNGSSSGVERKGEYFRKELSVSNGTTAQYPNIEVEASNGTNTSFPVEGNIFIPKTPELYQHDLDGNLLQDGRWRYTWDGENRLVKMETTNAPAGSARRLEFKYDWRGRRIYKKETNLDNSQVTERKFVYDGWNLYAELDGGGGLVQTYIWALDLSGTSQGAGGVGGLVGVKPAGAAVHFVTYDGNGNVMGLVDGTTGKASAWYEYGPFGEPLRVSGAMGKANPLRFSTKYTENESGHVYYGYRYYSPITGRWLNRDPIEEEGGINLYAAINNDLVQNVDLLGLCDIAGLLTSFAQDAVKEKIKDIAAKQAIKTGAKAGSAAMSDGPLPIGDAVAAALTMYDGIGLYNEITAMKKLGKTALREVCQRLAENKNCLEDTAICTEASNIIKRHGSKLLSNSKGKGDEVVEMLRELSQMLKNKCLPCKTAKHHSDPKYLRGYSDQDRTEMEYNRHNNLHGMMDAAAGGAFRRGKGADPILRKYKEDGINSFKRSFYEENWNEFPDAGCDFFLQRLF